MQDEATVLQPALKIGEATRDQGYRDGLVFARPSA